MSRHLLSATALSVVLLASAAAVERTVTLAVDGMSCASCPYILRTALQKVPGVASAEVSYLAKTTVVTFDDAKTTVTALTQATNEVGFPSRMVGE